MTSMPTDTQAQPQKIRVLILEDSSVDAELMIRELRHAQFEVEWQQVQTESAFLAELDSAPDLILADYSLPQFDGIHAVKLLRERGLDIPFILISGTLPEQEAVSAIIKYGADDYLSKDRLKRLGSAVSNALSCKRGRDEQQQAAATLRASEERWRFALEGAGDGVWDWDVPANEMLFSKRWKEMLGFAEDEISTGLAQFEKLCHPQDLPQMMAEMQSYFDGNTPTLMAEMRMLCKDGSWKWILTRGMVVSRDAAGKPQRVIGTHADISAHKVAEATILHQANFDPLTELPNRRLLRDRLEQKIKIANRSGLPLALMCIDLDNFKDVNDTLGHDVGDILLKDAAQRLSSCVRGVDTVARMGGDEFTVILGDLDDPDSIKRVAQDILHKLALPFHLGDEVVYVSGSIGITLYPEDARGIDELLKNADQAMYAAKHQGRNCFSYFTPAMQEAAQNRKRLSSDLRGALGGNQFRVYYQPIVELATGAIHKAEALIRWQHPQRGLVSPAEFIPVAEHTGIITDICDWVFQQAALAVARWRVTHHSEFQISINTSPLQFRNQGIDYKAWLASLKKLGLPGQCIAVEITEGLLLDAGTAVTDQLLAFHDAGIQVSLDDFGTGYSSLSYLKKFDIDYLKIDQSFVSNMTQGSDDLVLCEAIIVMAHKLGLKVIAEGVETAQQRDLLTAAGCDYGQGYLFSKAIPEQEFEALLKRG